MRIDDLGSLPTEHPRSQAVRKASSELDLFLLDWKRKHQLTSAEYVMLLADHVRYQMAFLVVQERGRQ